MTIPTLWLDLIKKYRYLILINGGILLAVAIIEFYMGRLPLGPDGKFGWWDGNVWGSENSQRLTDAYSLSHIIHGIIFYFGLWLVARRLPAQYRLVLALIIEAGWEILENSPLIINRYRETTISLGYMGDSILNSTSDIVMMALGFIIARYSRLTTTLALVIILELGCLWWIRDNLTLNIIMLVHPIESIKHWQELGHTL
jgi:hypothetical protein